MKSIILQFFIICLAKIVVAKIPGSSRITVNDEKVMSKPSKKDIFKKDWNESNEVSIIATANRKDTSSFYRGIMTIVGGTLAHLTLGTLYCWANFMSYSPLNLRFFDGKSHPGVQPDALVVLPLTIVAQCITIPFCPNFVSYMGARNTLLLGSWVVALSVFLSSYAQKLSTFIVFYSFLFGAGCGLAYTAPMIAGFKWLPNNKGLVAGGVLAGFGMGGFFFNLIGTKLVNPDGINPVNGIFPNSVYNNFRPMLRKLSIIYALLSLLGSSLVTEPSSTISNVSPVSPPLTTSKGVDKKKTTLTKTESTTVSLGIDIMDALKTSQFWLLWCMIVTAASAGLNVASVYKQYANSSPVLAGDSYQALVGGLGALFNGLGRLFWGSVSDKIGFKNSFLILTLFQTLLQILYPLSNKFKVKLIYLQSI
jgi:OFA family oxalate/formate antiporter-like MFS transporter